MFPFISVRILAFALLGLLCAQLAGAPLALAQQPPAATKPAPAAQSALPPEVATKLGRASAALSDVDRALQNISEAESELGGLRTKVDEALDGTVEAAETLRPGLAAIKSQIEKLGTAPGKDAPAEASEMAAERSRLTALAAAYDGAIKSSEQTWRARPTADRAHHAHAARAVHQEPHDPPEEPADTGRLA